MALAVSLKGSRASSTNTVTTSSGTTTGGANTVFAVCIAWDASTSISSVTDSKSNTYTARGSTQADGNGGNLRWYTSSAGTGGSSHTVTVNFSGSAFPSVSFYEITGADTTIQQATQTQDSGGQPFTITSGALVAGNWVMLAACSNNTGSTGAYSANASTPTFTLLHTEGDVSNYWTHGVSDSISSGTGAVTPSFNRSGTAGGTSGMSLIAYQESSGVSITPSTGTLTLTGYQPTVTASGGVSITPSTGTLSLTGFAPVQSRGITPGVGTLSLTGFTPSLHFNSSITPGVGTLTVAGFAPNLGQVITPGVGTLTLTGYVPSQTLTLASPDPGVLVLTGYQPTVSVTAGANITTGVGVLTLTGYAPTQNLGITPSTGVLVVNGYAPSLGGNLSVTAQVGTLSLTGYEPGVSATANQSITAGVGTLAVLGYDPTQDRGITSSTGQIVVSGFAPTLTSPDSITPETGVLAVAGYAPSLAYSDITITPDAGQIVVTGWIPTVEATGQIALIDTHDGEPKRAREFKKKQEARRKALEDLISPPPVQIPDSQPASVAKIVQSALESDNSAEVDADDDEVFGLLAQIEDETLGAFLDELSRRVRSIRPRGVRGR